MKKIIYSIITFVAVFLTTINTTPAKDKLFIENMDALAQEIVDDTDKDPNAGGGSSKCPTGGMANTKCNYWKITVTYSFPWPTTTCETEGSHKCTEGKCPHGN